MGNLDYAYCDGVDRVKLCKTCERYISPDLHSTRECIPPDWWIKPEYDQAKKTCQHYQQSK